MEEVNTSRLASLPPAYPSRSTDPASTDPDDQQEVQQTEAQQPKPPSSMDSPESALSRPATQPPTSVYGAHLAIDDKAVLERIANSASSPQALDFVTVSAQAPEWFDTPEEEYESPNSPAPHFPMPGSAIEPTALSVYGDSDELRPIELSPSAPIVEDLHVTEMPSAPPMDI